MSQVSTRPEQSTSSEIIALADLTALAISGSGEFLRKTGATTFENATPAGDSSITLPSSSTNNAIVRWDGTSGTALQDYTSGAPTISDIGAVTIPLTLDVTGLITATGGITSGGNIISDTDSTDDLGSSSILWANVYADKINLGASGSIDASLEYSASLPSTPFQTGQKGHILLTGSLTVDTGDGPTDGLKIYGDWAGLTEDAFAIYDTSNVGNPQLLFKVTRGVSAGSGIVYIDEIGTNLVPETNSSSLTIGITSRYFDKVFSDELLLNSTAILNGDTAGEIRVTGNTMIGNGHGIVVGNTSQVAAGEVTSEMQVLGTTETDGSMLLGLFSETDDLSPQLKFLKSGHATIGSNTTVADNEELGKIQAYGADGNDLNTLVAEIGFFVDDAGVGVGQIAGEMILSTAADTGTLTTAMTISGTQVVTFANTVVGSITGNAATVTVDATTTDTTCFVALFESDSGSLEPQTDAALTYNADTNALDVDGALTASTIAADTTVSGTTITASTGFALGDGDYVGITGNEILVFAATGTITVSGATLVTSGTIELGHATETTLSGSSGVLSVEGVVIPSISSTNTFTNKRITARVTTIASNGTPTVNTDNTDLVTITALAVNITNMTTNLSGTETNGQKLIYRILDNGTPRTISWGTSFEDAGEALPTTTTTSKLLTVGFIYDTVSSKWGCVAVADET